MHLRPLAVSTAPGPFWAWIRTMTNRGRGTARREGRHLACSTCLSGDWFLRARMPRRRCRASNQRPWLASDAALAQPQLGPSPAARFSWALCCRCTQLHTEAARTTIGATATAEATAAPRPRRMARKQGRADRLRVGFTDASTRCSPLCDRARLLRCRLRPAETHKESKGLGPARLSEFVWRRSRAASN